MKKRYRHIIHKITGRSFPASEKEKGFYPIAANVISPVLVMYTSWIISEAEQMNIKRLYFLARDGFLMYHIAENICQLRKNGIKCSYFYCSRYSLRMAAYRFFDDSAYSRLFIPAYRLTASNMLRRADFDKGERMQVYSDIAFDSDEDLVMGRKEFEELCIKIKNSSVFIQIIKRKSDEAYPVTVAYIRQEEMHKYDNIGVIDLGWTGSMQYTLCRILRSCGINTRISGFYMGMLDEPPEMENSSYHTWLFNENNIFTKSWFSHNLMECICSAPHGMTKGFYITNNRIVPKFSESENRLDDIFLIKRLSLKAVKIFGTDYDECYRKTALWLLFMFMFFPSDKETEVLSRYNFCDDISEQYHKSIVQSEKRNEYRKQILPFKIKYRDHADGFYWYFGSVEASSIFLKTFYKLEYLFTRYIIFRYCKR